MRLRYRLQHKEQYVLPNVLGNCNFPVYMYRWKDIAISDDKRVLEDMALNSADYRVIDTEPPKEENNG